MSLHNISENLAIVATIDPDAYSANTYTTDAINMANFERVIFIVAVGDIASTGTVDFAVYADVAGGSTFSTALTGKAITQLTAAGTDSDKQAIVEVRASDLAGTDFTQIRGSLVIGTAACDATVIALGRTAHYAPVTSLDLASVDEIV